MFGDSVIVLLYRDGKQSKISKITVKELKSRKCKVKEASHKLMILFFKLLNLFFSILRQKRKSKSLRTKTQVSQYIQIFMGSRKLKNPSASSIH